MFERRPRPQCSWTGVFSDSLEAIPCGKVADGFIEAGSGRRVYTCEEHLSNTRERAGGGRFIHGYHPEDALAPVPYHVISRPIRHPTSGIGENS